MDILHSPYFVINTKLTFAVDSAPEDESVPPLRPLLPRRGQQGVVQVPGRAFRTFYKGGQLLLHPPHIPTNTVRRRPSPSSQKLNSELRPLARADMWHSLAVLGIKC